MDRLASYGVLVFGAVWKRLWSTLKNAVFSAFHPRYSICAYISIHHFVYLFVHAEGRLEPQTLSRDPEEKT